jgi:hypothetical protein
MCTAALAGGVWLFSVQCHAGMATSEASQREAGPANAGLENCGSGTHIASYLCQPNTMFNINLGRQNSLPKWCHLSAFSSAAI